MNKVIYKILFDVNFSKDIMYHIPGVRFLHKSLKKLLKLSKVQLDVDIYKCWDLKLAITKNMTHSTWF